MSVQLHLFIFIVLLYISATSPVSGVTAKQNKHQLKHVFIKDPKQKSELEDKFLDLIEASYDYVMQWFYYKAHLLGLDHDRAASSDVYLAFLEIFFDKKIRRRHHFVGHDYEDDDEDEEEYSHGGHHRPIKKKKKKKKRPLQHIRPQRPHQSEDQHHEILGLLTHHGRSLEDMKNSHLHKLLRRWNLCE